MTPPFNPDAEASVLGACLLSPHAIEDCAEIITPSSFYLPSNGLIFQAILDVHEQGKPVDEVLVAACLDASGKLKEIGGPEKIHELAGIGFATPNAVHWAKVVRANWVLRGLVDAGHRVIELGVEGTGQLEDIVDLAVKEVMSVSERLDGKKDSRVFTGKEVVEEFRQWLKSSDDDDGIPTPWGFLPPLNANRLYILAGYEKDGKTMACTQFLRSACESGARVGMASIEMGRLDLTQRLAATFGVPYSTIRRREIAAEDASLFEDSLRTIESWDWEIIDDETIDAQALRRHQRRGKYDLLIVDHLHRIRIRDRKHERAELEDQVRGITNISREFNIPVLLLAQLSRSGDWRNPYPRPSARSLKGTGAIEQEASHVWFIYRQRDENHQRLNEAEFIVAASRYGDEGTQPLLLQPRYMRFREMDKC